MIRKSYFQNVHENKQRYKPGESKTKKNKPNQQKKVNLVNISDDGPVAYVEAIDSK
jgi:hypothetical protein